MKFAPFCVAAALTFSTWPGLAADRRVELKAPADIRKDLAAMPRIDRPRDNAERKINVALARFDSTARKAAAECQREGRGRSWWERHVAVPMKGPRFISYVITDNVFCGGAHPSVRTIAIVYDLASGLPMDWTALLPSSLTGTVETSTEEDGNQTVTLTSRRLHALYVEQYRPKTGNSEIDAADEDCRIAVGQARSAEVPPMMAWLDAKEGGLATRLELSHAMQACVDDVVVPIATLRAEGASQQLINALQEAHRPRAASQRSGGAVRR
jgi:hypothetical protein